MTVIDYLPRFTLANFKSIFDKARNGMPEVREYALQHPEHSHILEKLIEEQLLCSATLDGRKYKMQPRVCTEVIDGEYTISIYSIEFNWKYDGRQYQQNIGIEYASSNLGLGEVAYFRCPYTGRNCRKLYTDGQHLLSRWAFKHTYEKCNRSKHHREWMKFFELDEMYYQPYRKEYYRGKLTPYGRKIVHKEESMNIDALKKFIQG